MARREFQHVAAEQQTLRTLLIEQYRQDRRYRNIIVRDLEPLWKHVLKIPRGDPTYALPQAHPVFGELSAAVDKALTKMRLTWCGWPAGWAAPFVLADVRNVHPPEPNPPFVKQAEVRAPDPGSSATYPIDGATLSIEVTPAGARLRLSSPALGAEGVTRRLAASRELGFDEWDALPRLAAEAVQEWSPAQRTAWQAREDYRLRNATVDGVPRDERDRQDAHALFRFLFYKERPPRALRERLRRLCRCIALDLPDAP